MALNWILILLFLLGLTVTSVAHTPLCSYNEDTTRCVCNVMVIQSPESLFCFLARELELRDGNLELNLRSITSNVNFIQLYRIKKLIFNNVTISDSSFHEMISFLSLSQLNDIEIISSTIDVVQPFLLIHALKPSEIQTPRLEEVTVDSSFLQPPFQALHHWVFGSLTSFGLVRSCLFEFNCYWAHKAENLTLLDLSENTISLISLQNISHCSSVSFKNLKSLHLRNSNLTSLQPLCTLLNLTTALTDLDVSRNNFTIFHFPHCLQVKPLRMLNLSHSGIKEVNSFLSASLEELDLSYNSLEVFNNPPQTLKKLNLANNHLINLHFLGNLSYLKDLNVDSNQLTVLTDQTNVGLSALRQLDVLHAGRNPYQCDCNLSETVLLLNNANSASVDPHMFLCATPEVQKGNQIMKYSFETCVKPISRVQHYRPHLCVTLFMGLVSQLINTY
ncbi:toll-like receptor 2 [Notolabrus celidotus]|uniref:toll-like receptor 2 n=1 Tax=Notolabrus celidotus TaxID=1203425 RepID=UPI00148F4EDB|nr:toll-like receptor 2 [Notolabrus celidotus]